MRLKAHSNHNLKGHLYRNFQIKLTTYLKVGRRPKGSLNAKGRRPKAKMKLAIVGSRNYHNYEEFKQNILNILTVDNLSIGEIISGGASGADKLAERFAAEYQIPIKVFKPEWKKYGKAAGPLRNQQIIEECTHVIAFPSVQGKGTQDSIRKAQLLGKPIKIIYID